MVIPSIFPRSDSAIACFIAELDKSLNSYLFTIDSNFASVDSPIAVRIKLLTISEDVLSVSIEVFTDGLCQPTNPKGIACYAFVIKKENQAVHAESGLAAEPYSDDATNNVAEYTALIKSLEWLVNNGFAKAEVKVKSDSKLMINQMQGNYRVRDKRIIPIFKKAAELSNHFDRLIFEWIPREKNKEADALSERAYNNAIIANPDLLDKTLEHSS